MGILAKAKRKVVGTLASAADTGANLVAKTSVLSSDQLKDIEKRRQDYLSERPDTDPEGIKRLLGSYAIEAFEAYLPQISSLYEPIETVDDIENEIENRIRYFEITKWVSDPNEDNLTPLINMYQVVSGEECNVALIYNRGIDGCKVYLAVENSGEGDMPYIANGLEERLTTALKGNFSGAEIKERKTAQEKGYGIGYVPGFDRFEDFSVASVSNIATEKSEDFLGQRMEKLLDGICPSTREDEYTVVLLATPVKDQLERRNALSELYSRLAPYSSWQTNFTYSESMAEGSSGVVSATLGASMGKQFGTSQMAGTSSSSANAVTDSQTHTDTSSKSDTKSSSTSETAGVSAGVVASATHQSGKAHTESKNVSEARTKGKTVTDTIGKMAQTGQSVGSSFGANFGAQFSRSSNVTATIGKNEGITQSYVNHGIKYTLELIEKQIKRLEESSALGMWDFSAYFISENRVIANNAAHMYLALTQGNESYISQSAVNLWTPWNDEKRKQTNDVLKFIKRLQHPEFQLKDSVDGDWLMYPPHVNTTVGLTGRELARSLNFPRKSVSGLPILESVAFGREVQKFSAVGTENVRAISVGTIYHMRHVEKTSIDIDVDSLASHTFITGSTGTGKSNAIYQMLDNLYHRGVKFLVVEPAKGEYKKVFGKRCEVYGTNRSKSKLLRINPFSFPSGIHVLEHIDRLIEILNACWPMYAAMPAVLKDAIERCYEKAGWNLATSKCEPILFPSFYDLLETLPEVMNESLYSSDTKNDYSGALMTRVKSLTNGINGQILCGKTVLSEEELFENNVIIDLSRIGSNETRSLLMGIVVMKLQEYRLNLDVMNERLLHVTVLEEAHNLLRKTSSVQTEEGSNLQGKSVEMITNSIAEMRTYGEGFIIADQAPELLDEAVIRNTNTKIVLRLPDDHDRHAVGLSMALSEEQIKELAKLPLGVAAIYQNDWVESVLCHFEKYKDYEPLEYKEESCESVFEHYFNKVFGIEDAYELKEEEVDQIREWIDSLRNMSRTQELLRSVLKGNELNSDEREIIAYNVFEGKKLADILEKNDNVNEGMEQINRRLKSQTDIQNNVLLEVIRDMAFGTVFKQEAVDKLRHKYLLFKGNGRGLI